MRGEDSRRGLAVWGRMRDGISGNRDGSAWGQIPSVDEKKIWTADEEILGHG